MQRLGLALALVACSAHDGAKLTPPGPSGPVVAPAVRAPGLRLPTGATPLGYDLRLELDPDVDTFHGTVAIRTRIDEATDHVWVHADELDITSARWSDAAGEHPLNALAVPGDQMTAFGFGTTITPGTVTLSFVFTGHMLHDEEGLFRQRDENGWYVFSQGESVFARRITPCFDEPRFKTPWRVTLVVPDGAVAAGNMPVEHETRLADGRHELVLAETPPMPSYLLAVAVGPFEVVDAGTVGAAKVPVRVLARPRDRDWVGVVAARLPAIVAAVEQYTNDPFPWPKLDLVDVPHLFGAMENPGLITFDEAVLRGDPKSREHAGHFVRIAAHEIAHQWFGNLVTPAWWDDLWLAEAFASWLGDRVAQQLGAFDEPALHLALTRAQALAADDEPDSLPLHHQVTRTDDPESGFDAIAYEKGQAVLATFEAWMGEAGFQAALRAYLRDHRGGIATTTDLVAAIAAASTPAIGDALRGYVDHAGPPIVELALACDHTPRLVVRVRDSITVPLCVRYAGSRGPEHACTLATGTTELALAAASGCPRWVTPTDLGYYHVVWTSHGARGPSPPLAELTSAERIGLGDDLAAATLRGELAVPVALAALTDLATSHDVAGQFAALTIARALDPIVDETGRAAWTSWLATRFADRVEHRQFFLSPLSRDLEWQILDELVHLIDSDHLPAATVKDARREVEWWLGQHVPPDPKLVAAAGGDRAMFDRIAALLRQRPERAAAALAMFGPALAEPAVALATGDLPTELTWPIASGYFERPATRHAAWVATRTRVPALLAHLTSAQAGELVEATSTLCDPTSRAEVVAAFEPKLAKIVDGRSHLDHALASIDRCIARRAKLGDVAAALSGHK